jgi:hypothetical protein
MNLGPEREIATYQWSNFSLNSAPGNHIEEQFGGRRVDADVQLGVEEDRGDIGAVKHVLQIVGGGALQLKGS